MNNKCKIEMRGNVPVVTWGDDDKLGCHPASMTEKKFWSIIQQLKEKILRNNEQIEFRCKQMCSRGYLERGLHHPDCPSDYIIALEEEE